MSKNVAYGRWSGGDLLMDVYRPAKIAALARLPAIVFLNTFGIPRREDPMYTGWAKIAAAQGFAAINPDSHSGAIEQDFDLLLAYLAEHGAALHIDANQIAVHAVPGNVSDAFPLVENPKRTSVKAAVMYYGLGDVREFRADLPVLLVRAGLDRPAVNQHIDAFAANAFAHNAPLTLLNYPGGHHGFDLIDDNDASREVIEQTFRFIRSKLTPEYQMAVRSGIPEATAAAAVLTGDFAKAAVLYAPLVAANPQDPRLLLSYAEALLGAARYKEARTQFDRLKTIGGVGPRDLNVPAAKACVLDGDPDAAIAWLRNIPKQFRPAALQNDPDFAALRDRPDFQALFQ
ncbi:MAG TPA: tetratricopeptide repeat protein [Bryobacteraceae bacterium]|nr:tetratricopeptide repeat protein [Bryobacteraceae bacterium]